MKNILEYQKLDAELFAIERQYETSEEHEVLNKMSVAHKEMQTKLISIENGAKKLSQDYELSLKQYEDLIKQSKKLSEQNIEKLDEEKMNEQLEVANKLSSDLFMLERKINLILTSIQETLKEFDNTKKKLFFAKTKHSEAKTKLEELKQSIEPRKKEIEKQLKKLEPGLDSELFLRYKALKHDKIFPVFVPLTNKRCGHCRVELPSIKLDKLKNEKFIVCEHCGRLIYGAESL